MGYDESKVNWKPEEHEAGKNADAVYEAVAAALKDGIGPTDLTVALAVLKPSMSLWAYLSAGTREQFASKLIDLGVMLKRDNSLL